MQTRVGACVRGEGDVSSELCSQGAQRAQLWGPHGTSGLRLRCSRSQADDALLALVATEG